MTQAPATLRLLHLCHTLSMGGGEYHLVQDARGMQAQGCDVHVMCRADNKRLCEALIEAGVRHVPVARIPVPLGGALGFFFALLRHARAWKPDIICANTLTTALVAAFLKPLLPGRLIYAVMVVRHDDRLASLLRFVYRRLDGVLYNSRYTRDCYRALLPQRPPEHINFSTVDDPRPRLMPVEARDALRSALLGDGKRLVGFVGRIHPEKGVMDFLHMTKILHQEDPSIRFIILGARDDKFPDYADAVDRFARENLGDVLTFGGHVADAGAHIAVMDCLVNPTYGEGFGRVALEAAYLDTPIVATEPGGMTEILEGYACARMVPWKQPDRLAGAVRELLAACPRTEPRPNAEAALARFAPAALVKDELAFFRDVLSREPVR